MDELTTRADAELLQLAKIVAPGLMHCPTRYPIPLVAQPEHSAHSLKKRFLVERIYYLRVVIGIFANSAAHRVALHFVCWIGSQERKKLRRFCSVVQYLLSKRSEV